MSDHLQLNSAFYLALVAAMAGCMAGLGHCILRSRCTSIRACGMEIKRDVLPADAVEVAERAEERV